MEFLLFVQPIGAMLLPFVIVMMCIGALGALIAYPYAASLYYSKTYDDCFGSPCKYKDYELERRKLGSATARAIGKKFFTLLIVGSVILLPLVTTAQGWNIFKNMVIYQVATSDTADKAIDNTNLLMDKLNEFIGDWDPKAKVEAVEKAVETVTQEEK